MLQPISIQIDKSFQFTCDSAKLSSAISKAVTVTSYSNSAENERHHLLIAAGKALFVIGYSSETFIMMLVSDVVTKGEGSFEFAPAILQGLIKNRKELEFSFDKGRLDFKATKGKYSGSVVTTATTSDQLPYLESMMKVKSKSGGSISGSLLDQIRKAVKFADLKDYYNDEQILCAIRVKKDVLDVSAHDNFHMSYYKAKVDNSGGNFELAIPVITFKLIDKFISDEGETAEFFLDSKQFKIAGNSYTISLPPVQVDEDFFDRVPGYIGSLKAPAVEMKFSGEAIRTVDNMFTIADDETKLSLSVSDKGRVDISLTTDNGKIADAFKSEVKLSGADKFSFMIDPRIFADLFNKVRDKGEVPMRLFSKKNKGVSSCFMISASSKDAKCYLVGTYYEE